jgi:glycosyltransferase involved in cell wall biosynthesis
MNIAFISHASVLNGAPISLAELVDEMLGTRDPGSISIGWPVPGPILDKYDLSGTDNFFYGGGFGGREILVTRPKIKRRLQKRFTEKKVDLVIANSLESFRAVQAASECRIPVIWMIHELMTAYQGRRELPDMRSAAQQADRLIFNSRRSLAFSQELGEGIREKSGVIYPGVRIPDQIGDRRTIRNELEVEEEGLIMGSIGDICPQKGYEALIQAFEIISRSYPAARLMIIGRTPERYREFRRRLADLCRELDLGERVEFSGEKLDLTRWISALDLLIHPSRRESFGRVIVEALAREVPVVAARSGGAEEIIADGETGFLVPVEDPEALAGAAIRMISDPDQARAMAVRGRAEVMERYTIARTAMEMEEELQRVSPIYS